MSTETSNTPNYNTPLQNYSDVKNLLTDFVAANGTTPGLAPHGVFWNNLSYNDFITGYVPGVSNPNDPKGYKILIVGDPANSIIIQALSGTPNTPFDPNTGLIGQMPQFSPPYNATQPTQTAVINLLSAWIGAHCPNPTDTDTVTNTKG